MIVKDKHPPVKAESVVLKRPLFLACPRPPARKRGQTLPVQLDTIDKVLGDPHGPEAAATDPAIKHGVSKLHENIGRNWIRVTIIQ
jgi:hypothetical protein